MAVMPRRTRAVNQHQASNDDTPTESGRDIAVAIIAERYKLPPYMTVLRFLATKTPARSA